MNTWNYDYISICGKRAINEDRVLITDNIIMVLDGHGYNKDKYLHVVDLVIYHLPKLLNIAIEELEENCDIDTIICCIQKVCLAVDELIYNNYINISGGSTMTGIVNIRNKIFTVNIGDSETVLVNGVVPVMVTKKHKPSDHDEKKRINDRGGFVSFGRVNGRLAVSRAFGDYEYGKINLDKTFNCQSPIWAMPDVNYVDQKYSHIFIYSDGFGDYSDLSSLITVAFTFKNDLITDDSISTKLGNAVIDHSHDNITIVSLTIKHVEHSS